MPTLSPAKPRPAAGQRLRVRTEIITPEIAMHWLEKNEANRNVVQRTVEKYARDMASGRWLMTGEPIHFGQSGRLLNGQHRLWACVLADAPFESLVVRGIENEDEVMDVIDTPMQRTLSHALQIHGEKDTNLLAGIINMSWNYEQNKLMGAKLLPTHSEGLDWLSDHPDVRDSVSSARAAAHLLKIPPTPVGAACFLNMQTDVAAAEEFWRLATTGEGLAAGDPILAYRRWVMMMLSKRERPDSRTWFAYNLKAMALWRDAKSIRLLSWKVSEGMPEPWRK